MKYRVLAASLLVALAVAPSAWSQLMPERNPENATSSESLRAQSQALTEQINVAKSRGKDISKAQAERAEAEKAMQKGNDQEALDHFEAGEQALK
jgi:hypothetical protein